MAFPLSFNRGYLSEWAKTHETDRKSRSCDDRQARIPSGACPRAAFRPRRRGLRRDAADAVGRHQAARGDPRRHAGAARLALHRAHPRGRAHARLGAAHRRRLARHAPGDQDAEARALRPPAHRRDPHRAHHGGGDHHALSRQASRRALHHPVAHLDRDAGASGKSRDRCRHHLSRQRAARPRHRRAALPGALPADHRHRRAARQPRQGHLGGSRRGSALPAHARHAEPAHHRAVASLRRRRSAADAGIQFHDRAVRPRAHRPLGERHAVEARRDPRAHGEDPRHPHRRAGRGAHHRPRGAAARADDAAERGAGDGGTAASRRSSATRTGRRCARRA